MATLEELRVELDKIDNQMVELYQKRMNVCREVGDYKVKAGRKVYDRQREQEKLTDVASKVDNDFDKNGVQELYYAADVYEQKTAVPETGRGRSIRAVTVYSDSFP